MTRHSLPEVRAQYASEVMARASLEDAALEAAFAAVAREKFLGRGPWRLAGPGGYRLSDSEDPREVYVDALIALDAARRINNGMPSAHAFWIHGLELQPGDRVDHIGAGTGYYSAILAQCVGPEGHVEAFEIDFELARRARAALRGYANVAVHAESGLDRALPEAQAIYVNAGAAAPNAAWLDALAPGGRLVFPLTDAEGFGGMIKITRGEGDSWPARVISGAAFIDLIGGHDVNAAEAVGAAFRRGGADGVRWLKRDRARGEQDWLRGDGWRFTRAP